MRIIDMRTTNLFAFASALVLAAGCETQHPYESSSAYSYGTTPAYSPATPTYSSTTHGAEVISSPAYTTSTTTLPVPTSQSLSDTDNALISRIHTELTRHPSVSPFEPNVHVYAQNGAVTLTGAVPNDADRQAVDTFVRRLPGVASVRDEMQIAPGAPLMPTGSDQARLYPADTGNFFNLNVQGLNDTDRAVAQRILTGLRTDSAVAVIFPHVNIEVSDGKVTLRGTVQSIQQRRAIVAAVQQAAGFNNVFDELQVSVP